MDEKGLLWLQEFWGFPTVVGVNDAIHQTNSTTIIDGIKETKETPMSK